MVIEFKSWANKLELSGSAVTSLRCVGCDVYDKKLFSDFYSLPIKVLRFNIKYLSRKLKTLFELETNLCILESSR